MLNVCYEKIFNDARLVNKIVDVHKRRELIKKIFVQRRLNMNIYYSIEIKQAELG